MWTATVSKVVFGCALGSANLLGRSVDMDHYDEVAQQITATEMRPSASDSTIENVLPLQIQKARLNLKIYEMR